MDNYISQGAAEERLNRLERESYHNSVLWPDHVEECREAIRDIPPANVRPVVKGEWEWDEDGVDWGIGAWVCSSCRMRAGTLWEEERHINPYRCSGGCYCGNCGAKMEVLTDG